MSKENEPAVFKGHWPEGVEQGEVYRMACDDKGRNGGSWFQVTVGNDCDVHLTAQDWEDIDEPDTEPNYIPTIRIRTHTGGGRNRRTRQALLWLADAIRRDNAENGVPTLDQ
jgi:hypothetical protein